MIRDVHTIFMDTPIQEAISFMEEKEIGCLPVTQDEHLVGIVTINDLTKFNDDKSA